MVQLEICNTHQQITRPHTNMYDNILIVVESTIKSRNGRFLTFQECNLVPQVGESIFTKYVLLLSVVIN